jgi:hypothetical protein
MRCQLQVLRRDTGDENSPELQAALEALKGQQVKLNTDARDLAARLGAPASATAATKTSTATPVIVEEGSSEDELFPNEANVGQEHTHDGILPVKSDRNNDFDGDIIRAKKHISTWQEHCLQL